MARNNSAFASITKFFRTLWASIICFFLQKQPVNHQSRDLEAVILPSEPVAIKELQLEKGLPLNNLETVLNNLVYHTEGFVEVDLSDDTKRNILDAGNQQYLQTKQALSTDSLGSRINHRKSKLDVPGRRSSRRQSAIDPLKSRILDDTFNHVHDKTLDVVRSVIITPSNVFVKPCSAEIEYYPAHPAEPVVGAKKVNIETYSGPILDACSAEIEHYSRSDITVPPSGQSKQSPGAMVESRHTSDPISEASNATVEFCPGPIMVPCSPPAFEGDLPAEVGHVLHHIRPSSPVLVKVNPRINAEKSTTVSGNTVDEFDSYLELSKDEMANFPDPTVYVEPIIPLTPAVSKPSSIKVIAQRRIKKNHVQFAMYAEEVPFTPLPERISRRYKEKMTTERESLFDLLARFPETPTFLPTCPPNRISPGTKIPDTVAPKYAFKSSPNRRQSESSSGSSRSASSSRSGLSFTNDSVFDTSHHSTAPSTPESTSRISPAASMNGTKHEVPADSEKAENLGVTQFSKGSDAENQNLRTEGSSASDNAAAFSPRHRISELTSISRSNPYPRVSACGSKSRQVSLSGSINKYYLTGDTSVNYFRTEDSLEVCRANVRQLLSSSQSDDSDGVVEDILSRFEESSYESLDLKRPESLVWFANQNFMQNSINSADGFEVQLKADPLLSDFETITPLCNIVNKTARGQCFRDGTVDVEKTELARWEKSKAQGLKAFREALPSDDVFPEVLHRERS